MKFKINKKILTIVILTLSSYLNATSLRDSVQKVLTTNPNIIAERKNQQAYRMYVDERKGSYYPTLDIEAYYQEGKEKEDRDSDDTDGQWGKQDGYNAALVFRQYIYDGGLTPAQVAETKHQELVNKYRSFYAIENTVLETVKAYTGLVLSDEILRLTESMIKINEDNLIIAKEQESISGEVLETYQVSSKLHFIKDRYINEEDNKQTTLATFFKLVNEEPSKTCRPVIDEKSLPQNLDEAIKKSILTNHRVLEQIERIKLQRTKIAQSNAGFLPRIDLELKVSIDEDLDLVEDGRTDEKYARLNFNWNLFNGNKDKVVSLQEKIFLQEQKKSLEDITAEVIAEVKSLFNKHYKFKRRIKELEKYVEANVNIVDVYRSEFQAGTRTFVDILNAESELYESTKTLIEVEYALINNYYDLMFNLSELSDSILYSKNQSCADITPRVIEYKPKKQDNILSDELKELISDTDSDLIKKELGLDLDDEIKLDEKTDTFLNKTTSFKKDYQTFLEAPKSYYTLNIATLNNKQKADEFVIENGLEKNSFVFEFGKNKKQVKIITGVFSSFEEAKEELKNLNSSVLSNKPYIDNIHKHQKLYLKYN